MDGKPPAPGTQMITPRGGQLGGAGAGAADRDTPPRIPTQPGASRIRASQGQYGEPRITGRSLRVMGELHSIICPLKHSATRLSENRRKDDFRTPAAPLQALPLDFLTCPVHS